MDAKRKLDYDIVVVGGGNAGCVAAIEAHNAGAKVLLIEKAPVKLRGGNSRWSGGHFRVAFPRGTKDVLPLVAGSNVPKGEIEFEPYTEDDFYNRVMKATHGLAEKRVTEIYVNRSLETMTWMKEQGVQWELCRIYITKLEDRLIWPSGLLVLDAVGLGEGLVEMLFGILEKRGIQVLYETGARSLILNENGAVCGVIAKALDGMIRINAKSTILACGGFQANPEWRTRYLGKPWDLVKVRGTRYDTGEGIQMAVDAGAQVVGHWAECHASVVSEDSPMMEAQSTDSERYSYPHSIMVNRNGERFVDEGEDFMLYTYAKLGKEIMKQPGGVAFQVYDAKTIPLLKTPYQNAIHVQSDSLEELARELDIDVKQFLATVREFNAATVDDGRPFTPYRLDGRTTKGLKPDKTHWALKIDTSPYRAYAVECGLTMTYGGLKTNEKTQVIDLCDHPIKGLYAVGEITGGYFYFNYPTGTGLTRGAVMGRIAGAEAVANAK